ncbi:MAG TPA: glutaredoxin domain-containing protein [Candidatus Nanoarchaeia archaeon]|nr:glutaredoxin domain-containing protein [Candidatus Nanoarchaeia archaeon]
MAAASNGKQIVKVYSTTSCPYCVMAKDFLKKNNIAFEDINVGIDREKAKEMVQLSSQNGVPVIAIGSEIIIGFDKEKLKKALHIA